MVELNKAFEGLKNQGSLYFPTDIQADGFYPESIRFGIYKRQGPSYDKLKKDTKAFAEKVSGKVANLGQDDGGLLSKELSDANSSREITSNIEMSDDQKSQILDSIDSGITELKGQRVKAQTDEIVEDTKTFFKSTFNNASQKPTLDGMKDSLIQNIYLNMPTSVAFNEAVQWQGTDLGIIGALKSGEGATNALENGLLSNAGSLLGGGALAIAGGTAGGIVGAILGGGGLQSGIESTFNVKANPYKEQTFEGVDFRTFDFAFAFRARSQGDVNMIQNIITSFRACSKPTYDGDKGETGVFAYPKEFLIEFLTLDANNSYQTNKYLPELKACVCTGVNTNFAGSGWRSFAGGAPVDISLQLTFVETEIITGEDVLGATAAGRFAGKEKRF